MPLRRAIGRCSRIARSSQVLPCNRPVRTARATAAGGRHGREATVTADIRGMPPSTQTAASRGLHQMNRPNQSPCPVTRLGTSAPCAWSNTSWRSWRSRAAVLLHSAEPRQARWGGASSGPRTLHGQSPSAETGRLHGSTPIGATVTSIWHASGSGEYSTAASLLATTFAES